MLGGLQLLLARTALGRRIRAAAEDPDAAELVGVDARAVYGAATALTMVLVTLAGVSLALRATFDPYAGPQQLIFAFEAAVIGGARSLRGTLLGGVALGIAQSLGAQVSPRGFLIAGHAVFLVMDRLTTLYIYGILAMMWSALAGHAGLLSRRRFNLDEHVGNLCRRRDRPLSSQAQTLVEALVELRPRFETDGAARHSTASGRSPHRGRNEAPRVTDCYAPSSIWNAGP